jgi:hypothetical protein
MPLIPMTPATTTIAATRILGPIEDRELRRDDVLQRL